MALTKHIVINMGLVLKKMKKTKDLCNSLWTTLIFGGWRYSTNSTNSTKIYSTSEMFSLDLFTAFHGFEAQWDLVLEGNIPVYEYFSTALRRIYMYNYSSTKWSPAKVNNVNIRQKITGVIDDKGIIYFFAWSKLNIFDNLPLPCSEYTANLMTNRIIVYLGGYETSDSGNFASFSNLALSSMNTIKLFNTKKSVWSQMNVTGDTQEFIILLYYVKWSIPSQYPSSHSPPLLFGHSANIHELYMIVTFAWEGDIFPGESLSVALVIGLGVGGFVLLTLVSMEIIFLKKNKKKRATHPI
ncbi:hypothetical protein Glove_606g72 [Diversispora epigaea]|uniref:Uncharacterized protein n=1 Tax=Diversispora epigaea TaxID=1348612 RepID=A0A397G787_9GLOM|nr:hypothetical protein Glove_606g72 [Diversispora epigaea]